MYTEENFKNNDDDFFVDNDGSSFEHFEMKEAHKNNRRLENIQACLYEKRDQNEQVAEDISSSSYKVGAEIESVEISRWQRHFPFLRVQGASIDTRSNISTTKKQVLQQHPSSSSSSSSSSHIYDQHDDSQVSIEVLPTLDESISIEAMILCIPNKMVNKSFIDEDLENKIISLRLKATWSLLSNELRPFIKTIVNKPSNNNTYKESN